MFIRYEVAVRDAKTLAQLDQLAGSVYQAWGAGCLTDEEASLLASAIEVRRKPARAVGTVAIRAPHVPRHGGSAFGFRKPKRPRSPDRAASLYRRRQLAFSGPMPPQLASGFTVSGLAVLRVVSDAVCAGGRCEMTVGEIASRAGVCMTTARNAIRLAAGDGLIIVEERRRHLRPNLPNVIRIISREWRVWIDRGQRRRGGGSKKMESTNRDKTERPARDTSMPHQGPAEDRKGMTTSHALQFTPAAPSEPCLPLQHPFHDRWGESLSARTSGAMGNQFIGNLTK